MGTCQFPKGVANRRFRPKCNELDRAFRHSARAWSEGLLVGGHCSDDSAGWKCSQNWETIVVPVPQTISESKNTLRNIRQSFNVWSSGCCHPFFTNKRMSSISPCLCTGTSAKSVIKVMPHSWVLVQTCLIHEFVTLAARHGGAVSNSPA